MLATKVGIFTNSTRKFTIGKDRFLETCSLSDDVSGISSAPVSRKLMSASHVGTTFNGNHRIITPIQLNKCLGKDNFDFVIIDLRDSRHYQNGHIKGARSTNCTTKLMSKKSLMDWKRQESPGEDRYILYDQHSDLPSASSPHMVLIEYLLVNNKQITFLQGCFSNNFLLISYYNDDPFVHISFRSSYAVTLDFRQTLADASVFRHTNHWPTMHCLVKSN